MKGRRGRLRGDTRGAVFLEHAIALLPTLLIALCIEQTLELWAGDLVMRRAAAAAARAAVVVLPDDPVFYGGVPAHRFAGARKTEIELAAALVLAASPHFPVKPSVSVGEASAHEPLAVTVSAPFQCFSGWLGLVCGGSRRMLRAQASAPYQGAAYSYR